MKIFSKPGDFSRNKGRSQQDRYKAVCASCGKTCEVPFKPTGDKPIFCDDCFKNKRHSDRSHNFDKKRYSDKKMYRAVCASCGKTCEVPFRPTGDKPVYCSDCFGKGSKVNRLAPSLTSQQFETLNSKLDKILSALAPAASAKTAETKKEAKPKKEAKAKPKAAAKKAKTVKKAKK